MYIKVVVVTSEYMGWKHPEMVACTPTLKFRGPTEKQWVKGSVERDSGLEVPSTKK